MKSLVSDSEITKEMQELTDRLDRTSAYASQK